MNLREKLAMLPENPGVYLMKDKTDAVIYVGKAKNLRNRVRQYFGSYGKSTRKVESMVKNISDFEYIIVGNEVESLILESNLIKELSPKYNILLRDDKQYPYIKVTVKDRFPKVEKTRRIIKDGAKYFGPYPNVMAVNDAITVFEKRYMIRDCKLNLNKKPLSFKPCLNFFIKKCMGPCKGDVTEEEYSPMIDEILNFLAGDDTLINSLEKEMMDASKELNFEKAAELRDMMNSLIALQEKQLMDSANTENRDIIAFARGMDSVVVQIFFIRLGKIVGREHFLIEDPYGASDEEIISDFMKQFYMGAAFVPKEILTESMPEDSEILEEFLSEKAGKKVKISVPQKGEKSHLMSLVRKNALDMVSKYQDSYESKMKSNLIALEKLQEALNLKKIPKRIECYDISNISGVESVGSMVVFENGDAKKSDYRKFRIKTVVGPDDYASLKEVLERRFKRAKEDQKGSFTLLPDLILMDGGKGQVGIAKQVMEEMGIEIEVAGLVKDDFHTTRAIIYENREIPLEIRGGLYRLLYKIQEEAHRFAIGYHRSLHSKTAFKSELDDIEGIGKIRKQNLMKHFKTIDKIKEATIEELMEVPSMNRTSAEELYNHWRKK